MSENLTLIGKKLDHLARMRTDLEFSIVKMQGPLAKIARHGTGKEAVARNYAITRPRCAGISGGASSASTWPAGPLPDTMSASLTRWLRHEFAAHGFHEGPRAVM